MLPCDCAVSDNPRKHLSQQELREECHVCTSMHTHQGLEDLNDEDLSQSKPKMVFSVKMVER